MNGSDTLFAIASIAVTLAGFASVVTALRTLPGGRWLPEDAYRLGIMVQNSIATLFLALLPSVLHLSGLAEPTVWYCSSMALVLYLAIAVPVFWVQRRGLPTGATLSRSLGWVVGGLALLAGGLQVANLATIPSPRQVGLYVGGLLVLVALSMLPFVRLVAGAMSVRVATRDERRRR